MYDIICIPSLNRNINSNNKAIKYIIFDIELSESNIDDDDDDEEYEGSGEYFVEKLLNDDDDVDDIIIQSYIYSFYLFIGSFKYLLLVLDEFQYHIYVFQSLHI